MTGDWMLWPRDKNLGRTLNPITGWTELATVERYNAPDTVMITGPAAAIDVFEPGMGVVVYRDGEFITSGNLSDYEDEGEFDGSHLEETVTLAFDGDSDVLDQVIYQQPSKVLTSTPSTMSVAYDTRSGPRETMILGYIDDNVGPGAITSRRVSGLVVPASLGRGGSSRFSARTDQLDEVVAALAEAGKLRVRVVHDESTGSPRLLVTVTPVPDVSANVFFGKPDTAAPGMFSRWRFAYSKPKLTRAIVAGGGEKAARLYGLYSDATAEALWGRRRESVLDQRQTTDTSEITDAGTEAVTDGATPTEIEFTVVDGPDVQYRRDYQVGYKVGIRLPGLTDGLADNVVREVKTTVRRQSAGAPAETVEIVVGSNGASATKTKQTKAIISALRRAKRLERSM